MKISEPADDCFGGRGRGHGAVGGRTGLDHWRWTTRLRCWPGREFTAHFAGRRHFLQVGALALVLGVTPAAAAVRLCARPISSGPQAAATEPLARQAAITAWLALVNPTAPQPPSQSPPPSPAPAKSPTLKASWSTAIGRTISCTRIDDGRVRCEATARPCVITQQPLPGQPRTPGGPQPAVPAKPKSLIET